MPITRDVIAVDTQALGTVYVPRFSQFMITAIMKKAEECFPVPDPKPYELPVPDALIEGDTLPAVQNPEYQKLIAQVMLQRNRYLQYAALSSVEIHDAASGEVIPHGEIAALYRNVLDSMRQVAAIPDEENVFALALHYCVLKPEEYREIINAATKEQALSQEEVRQGLRIFRRDVQRAAANGDHRAESTSDIPQAEQVQTQQSAG